MPYRAPVLMNHYHVLHVPCKLGHCLIRACPRLHIFRLTQLGGHLTLNTAFLAVKLLTLTCFKRRAVRGLLRLDVLLMTGEQLPSGGALHFLFRDLDVKSFDGQYVEGYCYLSRKYERFMLGYVNGDIIVRQTGADLNVNDWSATCIRV